jgi:hypothetical protein
MLMIQRVFTISAILRPNMETPKIRFQFFFTVKHSFQSDFVTICVGKRREASGSVE